MTKVLVTVSISTDREVWTKRRADVGPRDKRIRVGYNREGPMIRRLINKLRWWNARRYRPASVRITFGDVK